MNEINFKATFTTLSLYRGTYQCECVGTKNSSFTGEQVYLNLRIQQPFSCNVDFSILIMYVREGLKEYTNNQTNPHSSYL